jgi:hypothetical protein
MRETRHTWPADETARKGNQPQDAQEDRYSGDDFSVDPATPRPGVGNVEVMEVGPNNTCDDL